MCEFSIYSFVIEMLKILPVLVVGLFAASIAKEQKRIAQAKLKLDLFEKRLIFFNLVRDLTKASSDLKNAELMNEYSEKLFNLYHQSIFLFDVDVKEFIREVHGHVFVLAEIAVEALQNNGVVSSEFLAKGINSRKWLEEVDFVAPFKPYLDFSEWK